MRGKRCGRVLSTLLLAAAVCLAPAGTAAGTAAAPPRLLVFQIEQRGAEIGDRELAGMSDYLGSIAAEALSAELVDWRASHRWLRAHDLHLCLDRRCQMRVEHALGADYSLHLVFNVLGSACVVDATLYPAGSPASRAKAMHRGGCDADALIAGIESVVAQLGERGPLPARTAAAAGTGPANSAASSASNETSNDRTVEARAETAATAGADFFGPHLLQLGLAYAPAPLGISGGEVRKTRDHYGLALAYQTHLFTYLLIGAELETLLIDDGLFLGAGVHLGAWLPLGQDLGLFGEIGAGANLWGFEGRPGMAGPHGELALGLRHMVSAGFGWQARIAGLAGYEFNQKQDEFLLRLLFEFGVVFSL
mgnify:FL=1